MSDRVTINGKEYRLHYPYPMKRAIERASDKSLWDTCFSGMEDDLITILWAGLRHNKPDYFTTDTVEKLIDDHVATTGENPSTIYMTALRTVLNSNLIKVNRDAVNVLLDKIDKGIPAGEEGKGQAEA